MPDSIPIPPGSSPADSTDYSNPKDSATPSFPSAHAKIQHFLQNQFSLPFPEFMEIALYDKDHGYYAKKTTQVGRDGDFFTSVSTGPLFGKLLALRFIEWWRSNNQPSSWRILEIGAHNGQLALDVLNAIHSLEPTILESLQYAISEPLAVLRKAQADLLHPFSQNLKIVPSLEHLEPLPGIAFGNELLDALPFHLIKKSSGIWEELQLTPDWKLAPFPILPDSELANSISFLPSDLPDDYQTEVRTNFLPLLRDISNTLCSDEAIILFLDYGFASPEYYDPYRTTGTLRTFSKHKAAENPIDSPGQIDITAHVDFSAVAIAAQKLGYNPISFSNQGSYLTNLAKRLIQSNLLSDPKSIANFQTLTHPAHLGAKFHVIEFSKNCTSPAQIIHRLALDPETHLP